MRSSSVLSWLLAALLVLSLVANVLLYVAYAGTRSQLTLDELELDRLRNESDQARRRAAEAERALDQARRDSTARPAPTAAPAVTPTPGASGTQRSPTPATTPPAAGSTPAASQPTAGTAADPAQVSRLQAIEQRVSQIRGLQPTADVPLAFLDKDALLTYLAASFDRDYSPTEREIDQRRYEALGLLKPGQDIVATQLALLRQQVVGLYDPDTRQMYLIGDQPQLGADARITFAHEYTHALQDQHFGLKQLAPDHPDNFDRNLAVHAIMEGDAVLTQFAWARDALTKEELQSLGQGGDADAGLKEAPLVLREELLFLYTDGFQLVRKLYGAGGYPSVDAAFKDPPTSTEQVLHPEKYAAREAPTPVQLPSLVPSLGGDWRELGSNVMGELETRVLLEQFLDPPTAQKAAAGWGGDRFTVLTDGTRGALALRTLWDTPPDAQEFFAAYTRSLSARFGADGRIAATDPRRELMLGPDYAVEIRLDGQETRVLIGPDEGVIQRLDGAFDG